ncbi:MAG: hypothetical protein JW951_07180, partial [Lentisphaerae bacterium]|nr:hypothetical protein [Lentisphaerota bacterium]
MNAVISDLRGRIREQALLVAYRPERYEAGDVLDVPLTTVWPERDGRARFRIERYAGGGFAGQVYRAVLEALEPADGVDPDLRVGGCYSVKLLVPPSRPRRGFRNFIYALGFQAPFSAQVLRPACRAGLLFREVFRRVVEAEWGRPEAVPKAFASFYDPVTGAYGDVLEWVEGRVWRLEADVHPCKRRPWREADPRNTDSPEYVAKRQFMDRVVRLLRAMGARELARQYTWWTLKSQPNVFKRYGYESDPSRGLCTLDFRAGLALLWFLPMSPADVRLIGEGLRRGAWAQFDRLDTETFLKFIRNRPDLPAACGPLAEAAVREERAYRRSVPDLWRRGGRLCVDR